MIFSNGVFTTYLVYTGFKGGRAYLQHQQKTFLVVICKLLNLRCTLKKSKHAEHALVAPACAMMETTPTCWPFKVDKNTSNSTLTVLNAFGGEVMYPIALTSEGRKSYRRTTAQLRLGWCFLVPTDRLERAKPLSPMNRANCCVLSLGMSYVFHPHLLPRELCSRGENE